MNKRAILGILIIAVANTLQAELVRVTPMPPIGPGGEIAIDVNSDGTREFTYSGGVIIPLGGSSGGGVFRISLSPNFGVSVAGTGSSPVGLAAGEVIGPQLRSELQWVPRRFSFDIGSRLFNIGYGSPGPWHGLLGDVTKPYVGFQFPLEDGMHYGWIRFGNFIGRDGYYFSDSYIIEWAYETEPDTLVTILSPPNSSDSFAEATELAGTHFKLWSDNSTATSEPGDPVLEPAGIGSTLWWKWTAPADGDLWLASRTGPFETVFGVFEGSSIEELNLIGSSSAGCVNGVLGLVRDVQVPVVSGHEYFIMLDTRSIGGEVEAVGEIHLEGIFSTVRITRPGEGSRNYAGQALWLSVTTSVWDGVIDRLLIEANGRHIAEAAPGASGAVWFDPPPGPHEVYAVCHGADGVIRRSPARTIHVRPQHDDFRWAPYFGQLPRVERASNYHCSHQEGEPLPPRGTEANSAWWKWVAPNDGILALDIPDGNGEMSIAVYLGYGPWETNEVAVGSNPSSPLSPDRNLNHLQGAVRAGQLYSIAVRSMKKTVGSWVPTGPCDEPFIPGRDFTLRMDFIHGEVGQLLVKRYDDELMASFAAQPGREFVVESSSDLDVWEERAGGVATGVTQLLSLQIDPDTPTQFFRLKLKADAEIP